MNRESGKSHCGLPWGTWSWNGLPRKGQWQKGFTSPLWTGGEELHPGAPAPPYAPGPGTGLWEQCPGRGAIQTGSLQWFLWPRSHLEQKHDPQVSKAEQEGVNHCELDTSQGLQTASKFIQLSFCF